MNTDIRVLLSFRGNKKRRKLERRIGPGASGHLIDLWIGAASSRPDGVLVDWDDEDIALEANYPGDPGDFVAALVDTKWLDKEEDGVYSLHDWEEHNPYASGAEHRSDIGSKGSVYKWVRKQMHQDEYEHFKEWFRDQEHKKGTSHKAVLNQYRKRANDAKGNAGGKATASPNDAKGNAGGKATASPNDAKGNAPPPDPIPYPDPYPYPNPTPIGKDNLRVLHVAKQHGEAGDEGEKHQRIPYKEIVEHLNKVCGCEFKHTAQETRRLIKARWNAGFRLTDFKAVISCKRAEWAGSDRMCGFLRPKTLFGTNFESYLQEARRQGSTSSTLSDAEAAMEGLRREQEEA